MSRVATLLLACASYSTAWLVPGASQPLRASRSARSGLQRLQMMAGDDEGFTFGEPDVPAETMMLVEEEELTEQQKENARLRAAEKFMKKDTGDATCRVCGYKFKMETGDRLIPRMTPFQLLPDSYACPNCNSPKAFFDPVQIEIAGFADNQQYGFGTNTWTEGQKSGAIFGGMGLFVALFLAGYALN